ncbi:MAG: enoyl-CoA hydratase/isomerase family protein [Actinobacteria bacterium]|nr:enoyl-CoA hydratase/isomerase family protein [Actinomycetota bacterium]
MEGDALRLRRDERGVATLTMHRPAARNAFDEDLVGRLTAAAEALAADEAVRVVVLTGSGDAFSAGADLAWMRSMGNRPHRDNVAGARRLDRMLRLLYDLPKPLVGRVNGPALGGGTGLVAVCDAAVAADDALFGFTEVRLGLAPALVAPYVVRKVGRSFARWAFVSGERFDARRALTAGLVHKVARADELDRVVEATVTGCLRAGPRAVAHAKRLPDLAVADLDEAAARTSELLADLRAGPEAQEGMAAFLERRAPSWAPE